MPVLFMVPLYCYSSSKILFAGHFRDPLRLSHAMLTRTLTHHQVMPSFLDFVSAFGFQIGSRNQRFCRFKTRSHFDCSVPVGVQALDRSGRSYQICYNLRNAANGMNDVWSIRQAVFHHQFDIVTGNALWISVKGNKEIKTLMSLAMDEKAEEDFAEVDACFVTTLDIHVIYCQWCLKGWLEYIEFLETRLEEGISKLHVSVNSDGGTAFS
jgi:hypothetical protein